MSPRTRMTGPQLAGMVAGLAMAVIVAVAAVTCDRRTAQASPAPAPVGTVADTVADTVAARPDSTSAADSLRRSSAKKRRPAAVRPEARDYLDEVVTGRSAPAARDTRGQ